MDNLYYLTQKYRKAGVIYDTNVLLLYFCGLYNQQLIGSFKRVSKFTVDDFGILCKVAQYFQSLITTPHILSEVSNLLDDVEGRFKDAAYAAFARQLTEVDEIFLPAKEISEAECFGKLGLTDSGIRILAEGKYLVLTEDFPLLSRLHSLGIDALNFNHLRGLNWFDGK